MKNILFINLEKRVDRLKQIQDQLKTLGWTGERFKAVKLKNGALGCSMSHLRCVKMAKARQWEYVIILEDDIFFTNPKLFKRQFEKFMSSDVIWDVGIIAGNNIPPFQRVSDFCIKVSHCQTTTGYVVKKHYYDTLIKNFKDGIQSLMRDMENHLEYAIDKNWIKLQKKDNWFMIIPATVTQKPDYSDIEQKPINYNWHLLDIEKRHWREGREPTISEKAAIIKMVNIV